MRGVFGPGTAVAVLCQAGEMIVSTYVIAAHRCRLLRRTTFHFNMRSKFGGSRSVYRPRGSIQHGVCLLTEDVRDGAGQWWAAKLYIH